MEGSYQRPRTRLSGDFHSSSSSPFVGPAAAPSEPFHVDPYGDLPYRIHNFGGGDDQNPAVAAAAAPALYPDDFSAHQHHQNLSSGPYLLWQGQ